MQSTILFVALVMASCKVADVDGKSIRAVKVDQEAVKARERAKLQNPITYLEHFGYLNPGQKGKTGYSKTDEEKGIVQFQRFYHLPVTAALDNETIQLMQKPRCGVKDMNVKQIQTRAAKRQDSRGLRNFLTWKTISYAHDLNPLDQRNTFRQAFKKWSDAAGIPIKEESPNSLSQADIKISFVKGSHGDNNPFDGKGGELGHGYSSKKEVHFDDDEDFALGQVDRGQVDLDMVATHEFGHVLGLNHSPNKDAIMFAYYNPNRELHSELHSDDKQRIRNLFQ